MRCTAGRALAELARGHEPTQRVRGGRARGSHLLRLDGRRGREHLLLQLLQLLQQAEQALRLARLPRLVSAAGAARGRAGARAGCRAWRARIRS